MPLEEKGELQVGRSTVDFAEWSIVMRAILHILTRVLVVVGPRVHLEAALSIASLLRGRRRRPSTLESRGTPARAPFPVESRREDVELLRKWRARAGHCRALSLIPTAHPASPSRAFLALDPRSSRHRSNPGARV